jgi:hypothetical protein
VRTGGVACQPSGEESVRALAADDQGTQGGRAPGRSNASRELPADVARRWLGSLLVSPVSRMLILPRDPRWGRGTSAQTALPTRRRGRCRPVSDAVCDSVLQTSMLAGGTRRVQVVVGGSPCWNA